MSRIIILFFATFCLAFNSYAVSASNNNSETMPEKIKVALLSRTLNNDAYHDPTFDIETDYVNSLSAQLGLSVEFVGYPNVQEIHQALQAHQVDLAIGLADTSDSSYIYTAPLYKSSIAIWYRNKNLVHVSLNSMKWACVKGSVYCEKLASRGLKNIYQAQDFQEAISQVNRGEADAILDSYVALLAYVNSGNQTIGRIEIPDWFGAEDIRLTAHSHSHLLVHNINVVLNQGMLTQTVPSENKYDKIDRYSASFNGKENKTIRYTVWDDIYPLFYRDTSGELAGYLPDMLKLIESRTALRFDYVDMPDGQTPLEMLERGDIDFLPSVTIDAHEFDWTHISEPLTSIKYFSVSYKGSQTSKNAGEGTLFSDSPAYQGIKSKVFGENTAIYTSVLSLVDDLKAGKLRHAYVREDILNYLITHDDEKQLTIDKNNFKQLDIAITVRKNDYNLSHLINGVMATINPQEISRIQNGYTPFNIVYGYDKSMVILGISILAGTVVLLIFIGALWYKNFKLKVSINNKEAQRTKDDLTFLQNIINGLPNQIFIHDVNHQLLLSNCSGVEEGRCINCSLAQRDFPNEKVIENSDELSRVLEVGETIQRDIDVQTCSAGLKTIDYFRTRIEGPGGLKEFVLTVVNDVSEQKEQERALRAANETAQQAVQSRERFLASMSHELRTPIAGMAGLLEMLKIRSQDEDTSIMIDNIITSTRHLHLLVNDILDFSKLEAQQLELDLLECHVLREAGELLRVHCASAQKKGLQFEVNWAPSNVKVVRIDPLRFSQIINNLLSNAIKFTDIGKISVDVELDESQIHVAVSDTGEGMSQDVIATVFNPFFQADSTIARRFGGTGLGLSIVHNLIKVMGGSIHIESKVGIGSTVSFSIPHQVVRTYKESQKIVYATYLGCDPVIANWIDIWTSNSDKSCVGREIVVFDEDDMNEATDRKDSIVIKKNLEAFRSRDGNSIYVNSTPFFPDLLFDAVVGAENTGGTDEENTRMPLKGKVLVAEDNPINQLVFKQQLSELGVDVDIVDNGLIALELLQAKPSTYDLLITDCHMPVMDGYELVNRIRQIPELSHITLIGCTAEDSRVASEKASKSGFDSVLYKPYGINLLYKLLSQFLSEPQQINPDFWIHKFDHQDATILSQVYVDTMQSDLALLKSSKDNKNRLKEIAHRIKGGAGTIGETTVHQRALKLENCMQTREGNLAELFDGLVAEIVTSIEQTQAWINENQA